MRNPLELSAIPYQVVSKNVTHTNRIVTACHKTTHTTTSTPTQKSMQSSRAPHHAGAALVALRLVTRNTTALVALYCWQRTCSALIVLRRTPLVALHRTLLVVLRRTHDVALVACRAQESCNPFSYKTAAVVQTPSMAHTPLRHTPQSSREHRRPKMHLHRMQTLMHHQFLINSLVKSGCCSKQ